jgi:hypothetical protein
LAEGGSRTPSDVAVKKMDNGRWIINNYQLNNLDFESDLPFLQKPFAPKDLAKKVREVLDKKMDPFCFYAPKGRNS